MLEFKIYIEDHGELNAGIRPYSEEVTIRVANGVGGEPGQFQEWCRQAMAEWFDGAMVSLTRPTEPQQDFEEAVCPDCGASMDFLCGSQSVCINCENDKII